MLPNPWIPEASCLKHGHAYASVAWKHARLECPECVRASAELEAGTLTFILVGHDGSESEFELAKCFWVNSCRQDAPDDRREGEPWPAWADRHGLDYGDTWAWVLVRGEPRMAPGWIGPRAPHPFLETILCPKTSTQRTQF